MTAPRAAPGAGVCADAPAAAGICAEARAPPSNSSATKNVARDQMREQCAFRMFSSFRTNSGSQALRRASKIAAIRSSAVRRFVYIP
jgi:hypothetical protein